MKTKLYKISIEILSWVVVCSVAYLIGTPTFVKGVNLLQTTLTNVPASELGFLGSCWNIIIGLSLIFTTGGVWAVVIIISYFVFFKIKDIIQGKGYY